MAVQVGIALSKAFAVPPPVAVACANVPLAPHCALAEEFAPVVLAEALHFASASAVLRLPAPSAAAVAMPPNPPASASLPPFAVPFATPCSSEAAVTEPPFDALLVDLPPVSDTASEKLPPV